MTGDCCIDVLDIVLGGRASVPFAWKAIAFSVDMPTEAFVFVVTLAMIASEAVVPVSLGRDGRAGVMIDVLTGTVTSAVLVDAGNVLAGTDAGVWPEAMTALASMPMLTSSKEALAFGSGASSCWPATA